jgi:hypothetical protein
MNDLVFVLDSNVFIEAAHRYYAFDLAPRFWESLVEHAVNGRIQSIDRIKLELERGKDALATWAKKHFGHAFASTDEADVVESYRDIMNWVNGERQFSDAAKADFANGADGWLIAHARAKRCVVVTHEVGAPDARRRVPIPNVCQTFDVPFIDTFEMLRRLGVRWTH